jgi:hypothetical protein
MDHTRNHLFRPFRFAKWARLALVTFLSGEMTGGGGGGGTGFRLPAPPPGGGQSDEFHFLQSSPADQWLTQFLPWVLLGVAALFALMLLFLYLHSVFRFILFDAVLNDRWRLREGWSRWAGRGVSYFLWQIGYGLLFTLVLALAVGIPILLAIQAGWFKQPGQHVGALLLGALLLVALFVALLVVGICISVLAQDFVVPVMALDHVGVLEGWSRAWPQMSAAKLSFAGYLGMKLVLRIAAGIVFGILGAIVALLLILPLVIVGVALGAGAWISGLTWTPITIAVVVALVLLALGVLIGAVSLVNVPSAVFFQSYTLHFFAGRYAPLGAALARAQAPAAPQL